VRKWEVYDEKILVGICGLFADAVDGSHEGPGIGEREFSGKTIKRKKGY